jgi:hypothetical protein
MTWFRVDDSLDFHPKVEEAGNAAMGLWVRAGAYCSRMLTEGHVPRSMIGKLGGRPKDAAALVASGLWVEVPGGFLFHQWEQANPTKEKVLSDRSAAAERQRKARERAAAAKKAASQGESRRDGTPASRRDFGVSHGPPVPTRPDPTPNYPLITLVCRRLFGDASPTTDDEQADLWQVWTETAGHADLDAELIAWMGFNAATDLRNPPAALLGWLRTAAARATAPATTGCPSCLTGWIPDEFGQPSERPCPACRPHLRSVEAS